MSAYSWRISSFARVAIALGLCVFNVAAQGWKPVQLAARPLDIVENQGTIWVCGAKELIASSTDGGTTWNTRHSDEHGMVLLSIGFSDEKIGYATGTGGVLLFTEDGGKTWNRQTIESPVVYAASFSDRDHGLIHARNAVLYTSDGGKSWNSVPVPPKDDERSPGFGWVFGLKVLDNKRMAVMFKEDAAEYNSQRFVVTVDGGKTWKTQDIPNVTLYSFATHEGEYWVAGTEVIEKDKPGGGYGVPVAMHSPDGESWTHTERPKQVPHACTNQGCLYRDGEMVKLFEGAPERYWISSAEKSLTGRWAAGHGTICSVGVELRCSPMAETTELPKQEERAAIPALVTPPAIGGSERGNLQCIFCPMERVVVTRDYQGIAEVELKLHIDEGGLVSEVEVAHAANPEIGDQVARTARSWIFEPKVKNGVAQPAVSKVTIKVQAIKGR